MPDVFISYEHESKSIADNVVSVLESRRIRCWYAPRDVIGDYATSIVDAIESSKVLVLILSKTASDSPHVLNEVEIAYQKVIEGNLTIVPFKIDDESMSRAMEYYIKRLHWIDATSKSLEAAIDNLYEMLADILQIERVPEPAQAGNLPASESGNFEGRRVSNQYHRITALESERLRVQKELLEDFDRPVYDKLLAGRENLAVLDLGSNDGSCLMARLGDAPQVSSILGLEFNESAVEQANREHGREGVEFVQCDVEDRDRLNQTLTTYLEEYDLAGFDHVNVSMLILHLKKPFQLLQRVKRFMKPGATLFVRDIDDGENLAFPDEEGAFERVFRICSYLETSGFRESGRQIPGFLKKAGFKDITLEKNGLTTIGLDQDERSALFQTYFSFIVEDLMTMASRHPDDEGVKADVEWYREVFDDLEEAFHGDDFFFQVGFMTFTARR